MEQDSRHECQNHGFFQIAFSFVGFRIFKLPESFWNRFRLNLVDQKMNLEKNWSKNIYFFMKKIWSKKSKLIFSFFFRFQKMFKFFNEKSKILVLKISIFHWNFSDFEKSQKYVFSTFLIKKFSSRKKSGNFIFYLYKSKISPGFQKSHLENQRGPLSLPSMVFDYFFPKFSKNPVDLA